MDSINWNILSLKKGSAGPNSDYIWGRGYFDYKDDVVATGCGNLPAFCHGDPGVLLRASDQYERKGGSAARHLTVTLPRELRLPGWIGFVERLIQKDIAARPYQYAIHVPRADVPGESHPHVHILYCDRIPDGIEREPEAFFSRSNPGDPTRGGCRKASGGKSLMQMRIEVVERRSLCAELLNEALEAEGHSARVDHRPKRQRKNSTK
jgi:hypothetical protein